MSRTISLQNRRKLKREGNKRTRRSWKNPRYSRVAFCDTKTVRIISF